jgi:alpha-amylase
MYLKNYVKVRFLENHDFGRANTYLKDTGRLKNIMTLAYFCKGMAFLFNGIEVASEHLPNLFEIDEIDWKDYNKDRIVDYIKKLNQLKKRKVFADGIWNYKIITDSIVKISLENTEEEIIAIINLNNASGMVNTELEGKYENYMTNEVITIHKYLEVLKDSQILIRKK